MAGGDFLSLFLRKLGPGGAGENSGEVSAAAEKTGWLVGQAWPAALPLQAGSDLKNSACGYFEAIGAVAGLLADKWQTSGRQVTDKNLSVVF